LGKLQESHAISCVKGQDDIISPIQCAYKVTNLIIN